MAWRLPLAQQYKDTLQQNYVGHGGDPPVRVGPRCLVYVDHDDDREGWAVP
jgi:hypothetical protein